VITNKGSDEKSATITRLGEEGKKLCLARRIPPNGMNRQLQRKKVVKPKKSVGNRPRRNQPGIISDRTWGYPVSGRRS